MVLHWDGHGWFDTTADEAAPVDSEALGRVQKGTPVTSPWSTSWFGDLGSSSLGGTRARADVTCIASTAAIVAPARGARPGRPARRSARRRRRSARQSEPSAAFVVALGGRGRVHLATRPPIAGTAPASARARPPPASSGSPASCDRPCLAARRRGSRRSSRSSAAGWSARSARGRSASTHSSIRLCDRLEAGLGLRHHQQLVRPRAALRALGRPRSRAPRSIKPRELGGQRRVLALLVLGRAALGVALERRADRASRSRSARAPRTARRARGRPCPRARPARSAGSITAERQLVNSPARAERFARRRGAPSGRASRAARARQRST